MENLTGHNKAWAIKQWVETETGAIADPIRVVIESPGKRNQAEFFGARWMRKGSWVLYLGADLDSVLSVYSRDHYYVDERGTEWYISGYIKGEKINDRNRTFHPFGANVMLSQGDEYLQDSRYKPKPLCHITIKPLN